MCMTKAIFPVSAGAALVAVLTIGCTPERTASAMREPGRAPAASSAAGGPVSAQIIVKFRAADAAPAQADFLAGLSRDAGATLVYVRAMSGGAHVLRIENSADAGRVASVIERLSRRADVEYVEPDALMRHQGPSIR
jgi:hypothetical protein